MDNKAKMKLGRFICVEGIEATGKSTQVDFIFNYLKQHLSTPVIITREPGGTPLAESIRQLLLTSKSEQEKIIPETELLLLFAARCQHVKHVIQPELQKGSWIICDRFTETSYAYQGGGRGVSLDLIQSLAYHIQSDLNIDRVILLDMPVSLALNRLKVKALHYAKPLDRIEQESLEFFQRARETYLARAKAYPDCYRIIDASLSIAQIQLHIVRVLEELLSSKSTL